MLKQFFISFLIANLLSSHCLAQTSNLPPDPIQAIKLQVLPNSMDDIVRRYGSVKEAKFLPQALFLNESRAELKKLQKLAESIRSLPKLERHGYAFVAISQTDRGPKTDYIEFDEWTPLKAKINGESFELNPKQSASENILRFKDRFSEKSSQNRRPIDFFVDEAHAQILAAAAPILLGFVGVNLLMKKYDERVATVLRRGCVEAFALKKYNDKSETEFSKEGKCKQIYTELEANNCLSADKSKVTVELKNPDQSTTEFVGTIVPEGVSRILVERKDSKGKLVGQSSIYRIKDAHLVEIVRGPLVVTAPPPHNGSESTESQVDRGWKAYQQITYTMNAAAVDCQAGKYDSALRDALDIVDPRAEKGLPAAPPISLSKDSKKPAR